MQKFARDICFLLSLLAALWLTAYGVGRIAAFFKEQLSASAYGVAALYAEDPDPILQITLWQGRAGKEAVVPPYASLPTGLLLDHTTGKTVLDRDTPTGDAPGNHDAFTLRRISAPCTPAPPFPSNTKTAAVCGYSTP